MIDHQITAIFSDDPKETFDDLRAVLDAIYQEEDGLHTIFFSRYFEYRIITEAVYIIKQDGFFVFLECPYAYNLVLDRELKPFGEQYTEAQTFAKLMYSTGNVEFIDSFPDDKGNFFYLYSLTDAEAMNYVNMWKVTFIDCIDHIQIEEKFFHDISIQYLEVRKNKFQQMIKRVIENDEVYEGLDDNPFSHLYYDKEDT